MKLFMFSYNTLIITLCGIGLSLLLSEYMNNRERKIYLYGAGAFLFYILDTFNLFLAEFFINDMSEMGIDYSQLITFPGLKIFVVAGISMMYTLIWREMLRLKLSIWRCISVASILVISSLVILLLPPSAAKVWLFYSVRQIWALGLSISYFIILKKHEEAYFYGKKFKPLMITYSVFLVMIIIEDSVVIPNGEFIKSFNLWLNERNITEDIMTVVILVMIVKLLRKSHKETTALRAAVLDSALENHTNLVAKNLEMQETIDKLQSELKEYTIRVNKENTEKTGDLDKAYLYAASIGLTDREKDVFTLLLSGKSNSEIADELYISIGTVKFHIHQIYEKSGCQRRSQLIVKFNSSEI